MHLEYVDNFVVLGTSKDAVNDLAARGVEALRRKGLIVHEVESASSSQSPVKVLGWQFQNNQIRPLPHRVWRVRLAIKELIRIGRCSGRQLEKVVGHAALLL